MNNKQKGIAGIATLGIIALIAIAGTLFLTSGDNDNLGADTVLPIAGQTFTLAGSGVSSSATSIILTNLTITQTGQKIQDSDLSDTFFITLEPGNRSRQEISSCTTLTQNSDGSATFTGCLRGLSPITPYTASSTLQFAHGGGSRVIFSDPPQLFNQFTAKGNDETIAGVWTFASTSPALYDGSFAVGTTTNEIPEASWINDNFIDSSTNETKNGTMVFNQVVTHNATTTLNQGATVAFGIDSGSDNLDLADKAYVDGVAVAGASDANTTTKGIVEEATLAEINSGATIGSTGAKLFMTPSTFGLSNLASTTISVNETAESPAVSGTAFGFHSYNVTNGDKVLTWVTFHLENDSDCDTGDTTYKIFGKQSTFSATSTLELYTVNGSSTDDVCSTSLIDVFSATTTEVMLISAEVVRATGQDPNGKIMTQLILSGN